MTTPLKLAFIGKETQWFFERVLGHIDLQQYDSPSKLEGEFDGIIFNPENAEQQLSWLRELRSHQKYNCLLMMTLMSEDQLDDESKILADGTWQSLDIGLKNIRDWSQREKLFNLGATEPSLYFALKYLWVSDKRQLQPLADWQAPQTYRYPILDCFASDWDESLHLLERLRSQKLIQQEQLIDRVRSCPECKRAHLSFIDDCPNCKSLDIEKQKSLHCFNCGFVGPETKFQRNGVLICPNCDTRLRHIGVDYDRPFEQFHCKSCSELFIDPEVRARCMQCGKNSSPDNLSLEVIYNYRLSEKGRDVCRHGREIVGLERLMESSLIPSEVFTFAANWLSQLSIRHQEQSYSLLAIKIMNLAALIDLESYAEVQQTIYALSQRVRSLIRVTDLVTCTSDDLYFILLPSTNNEGALVLKQKILTELSILQSDHESPLKIEISTFSSSNQEAGNKEDINSVMAKLINELSE